MNQRQRFIRKIVYACVIAALLLPLSWLSQPATTESTGGALAKMRAESHLAQAQLGEIDPASETIKLATLGMRGVAANILWEKANYYNKVEDWSSLRATLEQIARLQPNFVSVWVFQGWNLSYNISVQFDDYRDRYHWVIKGIDYLKEGNEYNRDDPKLLTEIGWTIAHKIGRADEHVQFRRLFRADDDFNSDIPPAERDNWLVGRKWLLKAEDVVSGGVAPVTGPDTPEKFRGRSPLFFHSRPVMCLVNYAEALEEEGTFGEVAKNAWNNASKAWTDFSVRDLPTPNNTFMRLVDKEMYDEKSAAGQRRLEELSPGLRERILAERVAALTPEEKEAYDSTPEARTKEQNQLLYDIMGKLSISPLEVAERIAGDNRAAALQAAEEIVQADMMSQAIEGERGVLNYDYWVLKCKIEPEDNTLEARKAIYDGEAALNAGQFDKASQLFTEGLKKWRVVIDAHPQLLTDSNLTEDLVLSTKRYRRLLNQLDEKFPEPFILQDVLDADALFHPADVAPASESTTPPPESPPT